MIYFDHAATSYPKFTSVTEAQYKAMRCYGANPGRGGYAMALETAEQLFLCREQLARFFGFSEPRRVVLMPNCTTALNTVIKSLLANGGRAVISDLEHNAVVRPLHALSPSYPCYDIAHVTIGDDDKTVESFRHQITSKTKAIICTHASNVLGCVLPIGKLAALAHERGIPIVVDAAQSAGHIPIDLERDKIDFLCVAGHKGLGGTMGTGALLCPDEREIRPLIEGGTGSFSLSPEQPPDLPERLESGTPNVTGICALRAGVSYLLRVGMTRVQAYEHELAARLYNGLASHTSVRLLSPPPSPGFTVPVCSFTVDGREVSEIGERLAAHGIACRCGLHCAPLAHHAIGTLPQGTVRLSLGITNTIAQVENCLKIFKKIL